MEINRKVLLGCLNLVMPVISSKSATEYQVLNFYSGRIQATNGSVWVDAALPEGLDLNFKTNAEPLFLLLKKLTVKNIKLEVVDNRLIVSSKNVEGDFAIADPVPAEIPNMENSLEVSLSDLEDFTKGLKFCRLGVVKDETAGPTSGVHVTATGLWSSDCYRILNWRLEKSINLDCCVPVKLIDLLYSFREEVESIRFVPGKNFGGCLGITLKDDVSIWATTIEGEYKDISEFFPDEVGAEVIELDEGFPSVLERHLGNMKHVSDIDMEMEFAVGKKEILTQSQKFNVGNETERKLVENVPLKSERSGEFFQFFVNPMLLKDVVGLSLKFSYFAASNVVLFSTDKFRYLLRARGV